MTPFLAEVVGTAILLYLGDGVVANVVLDDTRADDAGWIVITWGWAMAVFIAVFCVGPFSGAHINPAVTVGLATAGTFAWSKVPLYILAQFIGAAIGAALATCCALVLDRSLERFIGEKYALPANFYGELIFLRTFFCRI